MILHIGDWKIDVDVAVTMEYSAAEAAEHCTCAYCRNFYAAVDTYYPRLRPFLSQFGIDIEAPDELYPYDIADKMVYEGCYWVSGHIQKYGKSAIKVNDAEILPAGNEGEARGILLNVSQIILPWVLDEPMEETLSPANEPSFLNKMWDRLLSRDRKTDNQS